MNPKEFVHKTASQFNYHTKSILEKKNLTVQKNVYCLKNPYFHCFKKKKKIMLMFKEKVRCSKYTFAVYRKSILFKEKVSVQRKLMLFKKTHLLFKKQ